MKATRIKSIKRKKIYIRDGHTCVYCERSIYTTHDMLLTVDHVLARSLGGTNDASNLVTACLECNLAKLSKTVAAFLRELTDRGVDARRVARNIKNARRRKLPLLTKHQMGRVRKQNYLEQNRGRAAHGRAVDKKDNQ